MNIEEIPLIKPRRKVLGMSAILLPLLADDSVDWDSFVPQERGFVRRVVGCKARNQTSSGIHLKQRKSAGLPGYATG